MATLKEEVYSLIREYQNKPETNENMVCLGLQEIPTGFYVFIIPDKELPECQNGSLVERTIHDFFNYEKTHF